ncbi:hypothetical protein [Catellatospora vulcania]|uniref:hypothetical protein n=1 Tax=Catellatospora vulcania TaxID=1460450 RepID=UPI0012D39121|nr:hypothetical protein [Catellatospora vulcania]
MSHPSQPHVVNVLGTFESAIPPRHPTWCDRNHFDRLLAHTAFIGEIKCGPTLVLTVEIVDIGLGQGPQIHLEMANSRDKTGDAYELAAQAARDLSMLLAAGADIAAGCTSQPLELGVQR